MSCTLGRLRVSRHAALPTLAAQTVNELTSAFQIATGLQHSPYDSPLLLLTGSNVAATRALATSTSPSDRSSPLGGRGAHQRQDGNRQRERSTSRQSSPPSGSGQQGSRPSDQQRASSRKETYDRADRPGRSQQVLDARSHNLSPQGISGTAGRASLSLSPSAHLQPPAPQPQTPVPKRWDLVAANAPQRHLALIGDARTGVADDTTTNPFGEVTVDMIHHQTSNEVYWFKYEFAGNLTVGSHRDSRLSDYTRNLIYLLRAKDPKRWTVQALADKFRIRKQRVLAIIALKELEAHRIESGRLLSGPLAAYGLRVDPEDLHLQPPEVAGAPVRSAELEGEAAGGPGTRVAAAAVAAASQLRGDAMLPRVVSTTRQLQSQLLDLLRPHGFDPHRIRTALLEQLREAEGLAGRVLGGAGGVGAPDFLSGQLAAYRVAVEGVGGAVEALLAASPPLQEEGQFAAWRERITSCLVAAGEAACKEAAALPLVPGEESGAEADDETAASAGGGSSEALQGLREHLATELDPVMQLPNGDALQRFFFTLPPRTRGLVLRLMPTLAVRLNAGGVDLGKAARDAAYKGPKAASASASGSSAPRSGPAGSGSGLAVDVFGFLPVAESALSGVVAALGALEGARAALATRVEALMGVQQGVGRTDNPADTPTAEHLAAVRSLVRQYIGTDVMWADVLAPSQQQSQPRWAQQQQGGMDPAKKQRLLELLADADPTAVERALQVEAVMQLRSRKAFAEAEALAAGVGAEAAAAAASASSPEASDPPAAPRPGDLMPVDALAAHLEARVGGRVYGAGSGERHITRLASFPAFEGYSLDEFDKVNESELSALNRKAAEKLDAAMYDRFRQDLLYNLGVRGEKLRDTAPCRPPWPTNLTTALNAPVVVYDIGPDRDTRYPPLHVALGDGRTRPLNAQEQVFQERRTAPPRLPYFLDRTRRLPELD